MDMKVSGICDIHNKDIEMFCRACKGEPKPMCPICLCKHLSQIHQIDQVYHISDAIEARQVEVVEEMKKGESQLEKMKAYEVRARGIVLAKEGLNTAIEAKLTQIESLRLDQNGIKKRNNEALYICYNKIAEELRIRNMKMLVMHHYPEIIKEKLKPLIEANKYWDAYQEVNRALLEDTKFDTNVIEVLLNQLEKLKNKYEEEQKVFNVVILKETDHNQSENNIKSLNKELKESKEDGINKVTKFNEKEIVMKSVNEKQQDELNECKKEMNKKEIEWKESETKLETGNEKLKNELKDCKEKIIKLEINITKLQEEGKTTNEKSAKELKECIEKKAKEENDWKELEKKMKTINEKSAKELKECIEKKTKTENELKKTEADMKAINEKSAKELKECIEKKAKEENDWKKSDADMKITNENLKKESQKIEANLLVAKQNIVRNNEIKERMKVAIKSDSQEINKCKEILRETLEKAKVDTKETLTKIANLQMEVGKLITVKPNKIPVSPVVTPIKEEVKKQIYTGLFTSIKKEEILTLDSPDEATIKTEFESGKPYKMLRIDGGVNDGNLGYILSSINKNPNIEAFYLGIYQ